MEGLYLYQSSYQYALCRFMAWSLNAFYSVGSVAWCRFSHP